MMQSFGKKGASLLNPVRGPLRLDEFEYEQKIFMKTNSNNLK